MRAVKRGFSQETMSGGAVPRGLVALASLAVLSVIALLLITVRAEGNPAGRDADRYFLIQTATLDSPDYALAQHLATAISRPHGSRPCPHAQPCGAAGVIAVVQTGNAPGDGMARLIAGEVDSLIVTRAAFKRYLGKMDAATRRDVGELRALGGFIVNLPTRQPHFAAQDAAPARFAATHLWLTHVDVDSRLVGQVAEATRFNNAVRYVLGETGPVPLHAGAAAVARRF